MMAVQTLTIPQSIASSATPPIAEKPKQDLISPKNPIATSTDKTGQQVVNFYPSKDYISKNQAPHQVPMAALENLAKAHALANVKKLYPPGVSDYALAQALVEGRPHDFGVNEVNINWGSAPTSKFTEINNQKNELQKQADLISQKSSLTSQDRETFRTLNNKIAGLEQLKYAEGTWNKPNSSYEAVNKIADSLGLNRSANQEILPVYKNPKNPKDNEIIGYKKFDVFNPNSMPGRNASTFNEKSGELRVLAIANKYYENGQKAKGLDLIQLYNGTGPKAKEYRQKIQDAQYLLTKHPANSEAFKIFNGLVDKYTKEYQREKQNGGT